MRDGLDDLAELFIVGLALGGKYARGVLVVMARTWPDTPAAEIVAGGLEIAGGSKLEKTAERIVLASAARLADGEPIDDHMRQLIAVWCRRRLKARIAGRRSNSIKNFAVQWAFIERVWRSPSVKREAIVADLAKEFRLKRRRIFDLIKGIDGYLESLGSQCN
jgi:hypothetical protein